MQCDAAKIAKAEDSLNDTTVRVFVEVQQRGSRGDEETRWPADRSPDAPGIREGGAGGRLTSDPR